MRKIQNYRETRKGEVAAVVAGCAFLLGYYIFGRTGRGAMLSFICMNLMLLVADVYVIHLLVTAIKQRLVKVVSITTFITLAAALVLSWFVLSQTVDVIKDMQGGTQIEILTECGVQTTYGPKGIINLHYYLIGYDQNGEEHRFAISGKDADNLRNRRYVTVEYYPNIERIYEYY